jgi:hypothetical protein
MKKLFYTSLLLATTSINVYSQDLAIGNVSAGINSYNQSTGEITGAYFDVLNNDNSSASSFRIAIFLIDPVNFDPNDPNTFFEIESINNINGQSGNSVVTHSGIDIDINDTPNVPSGSYRILVCADEDDDISESDESNNCLYITTQGNNITYNASTASINENTNNVIKVNTFPNPAESEISFQFEDNIIGIIEIYNTIGKLVKSESINSMSKTLSIDDLEKGTYYYKISNGKNQTTTNKFIKL